MRRPVISAIPVLLCLLLSLALGACTHTSTPRFDAHFGEASRLALAQQVLDPAAGATRVPAHGLDGASAHAVMARYRASFAEPGAQAVPPVQFMLGGVSAK